jgi:hypothetical protein
VWSTVDIQIYRKNYLVTLDANSSGVLLMLTLANVHAIALVDLRSTGSVHTEGTTHAEPPLPCTKLHVKLMKIVSASI